MRKAAIIPFAIVSLGEDTPAAVCDLPAPPRVAPQIVEKIEACAAAAGGGKAVVLLVADRTEFNDADLQ